MPSNQADSEKLHSADDDEKADFRRASEEQRQRRAKRRADRDARQMSLADSAETKRLDEFEADDE